MARKDDIPDAGYLRLRLSYYDAIAAAFGFEVLDGTRPFEENLARLRQATFAELDKPYVHYVHANNADVGGADRVLVSMAQHATSPDGAGAPVRATVSLREPTKVVDLHSSNGTPVMLRRFVRPQTSAGALGVIRSAVSTPRSFAYFFRLFGREKPDVVHVNDLYDIVPAAAARVRRIPVVYHIRMIKTSDVMRRGFSSLIPRLSSASVSVSAAVRDHYFGAETSGASPALVIHDLGNDALLRAGRTGAEVRPAPLPGTGRLVLMVGRVEPWKGQHVFLDAVAKLDRSLRDQHTFALVGGVVPGSAEYFAEVAECAGDLGVEFLGERSDVPALLRAADVSVHSSVDPDPFPGVVVESMLAEALTIGARAGGVNELIPSTAVGLTTAPNDSRALAEALELALNMDPEELRTIGRSARRHVLGLVQPEVVDEQISSLYHRLVPRSGATLIPLNEKKAHR
jgi:glycosyltransferase involved in cell wall biosynthesis